MILAIIVSAVASLPIGCSTTSPVKFQQGSVPSSGVSQVHGQPIREIEPPNTQRESIDPAFFAPPLTATDSLPQQSIELTLDEAIKMALQDTRTMRSLGAQVLSNPGSTTTAQDPSIQSTDPIFGIDAALAQFDANLNASLLHQNNDDVFNNSILGGGATEIVQDLTTADVSISKTTATGTQFNVRSNLRYDNNDNPSSIFPSSYRTFWEAQARQPLLQGRGVDFNRIAGPNATLGFRNTSGLLISRINNDISLAQFEQGVTRFVDEVIQAYWDLYFAYRNFDTVKTARDGSLETWNVVKARFDNDLEGGEADKEAQAREQYYQFQQQVVAALNGDPQTGVRGILQAEADLRRLIGLPQSDGSIIRPTQEPFMGSVAYDWNALLQTALLQRVELRQQLWQIRRRELELLASKNFLLPNLDAIATFRNNGFGDALIDGEGDGQFSSAFNDAISGDHNEWEFGFLLDMPIGFRQAHAGVRNAELQLVRDRQILSEQEKQIAHQLGSALRSVEQSYSAVELAYNRMLAAQDAWLARKAAFTADTVTLDLLLESVRRMADAQAAFDQAQVNAQLANETIQRESGQLLKHHAVNLMQAPSANDANIDVEQRRAELLQIRDERKSPINYRWR